MRMIQVQHLLRIIEQVDLIMPANESAEFYSYQAYQQPPVIQLPEQLLDLWDQNMIGAGVGDLRLFGVRIKIGIADLHADHSR